MALGPYPTLVPNCGTITLLIWLMYQILITKPSDQLSIWLIKSLCLKMMFISFNWSKWITPFYVPHPCTYSLHCTYFCTQSFTSPWLMLSVFLTTLNKAYCIVLYCFVLYRMVAWEIALKWMAKNFIDEKSAKVQVMAWCRKAAGYCVTQSWHKSMSTYGVTRPNASQIIQHSSVFACVGCVPLIKGQ